MRRILIMIGVLTALPVAQALAAQRYVDPMFGVTVTHDIAYGQAMNRAGELQTLLLDLYEPDGDTATARPVYIFLHGSLYGSDKTEEGAVYMATQMAARGYVAASVNFRLLTRFIENAPLFLGGVSPYLRDGLLDAQHDVQASVRWFRAHAADRRIDPARIAVSGHSAGGGIALLVNYNSEDPGDSGNPGYPSNVSAAVSHSGSMLEPSSIGMGEPPAMDIHALDDTTAPIAVTLATTVVPARLMGNVFEMTIYTSGGHGLSGHREERVGGQVSFLCVWMVTCETATGQS